MTEQTKDEKYHAEAREKATKLMTEALDLLLEADSHPYEGPLSIMFFAVDALELAVRQTRNREEREMLLRAIDRYKAAGLPYILYASVKAKVEGSEECNCEECPYTEGCYKYVEQHPEREGKVDPEKAAALKARIERMF